MSKTLQEQLNEAWEASELTLEQLRAATGLPAGLSSLSRKLRGRQVMSTEEAEVLARVLNVKIETGGDDDVAAAEVSEARAS